MPRRIISSVALIVLAWAATFFPSPSEAGQSMPLPRIAFAAATGETILVHGTYPVVPSPCRQPVQPLLHARYPGTVEVGKDTDGSLFVIAEIPFEDYVNGIGEMPRTWPMEALRAQAVAARSYALAHMTYPDPTGSRLGYQLCATTACQVYRGQEVAGGPYGGRWRAAVASTAGQVLLYRGKPADTLYFSTSNGKTYGNDQIFSTDPLPYLRPVTEKDDGTSPLSHWSTSMPFADVGRFLSASGAWPSGKGITSIRLKGSTVTVSGKGTNRKLDVVTFRSDLNSWAHCLDPSHYPTGGLPQAVPSRWFDLTTSHKAMSLAGRGWGHGVGMVQWGAYGKAVRGLSYGDILAAYFGGLRPKAYDEPGTIRVGIATGLKSVEVAPEGTVAVTGRSLRNGPWLITGGKSLTVHQAKAPPVYIGAGSLRGPRLASTGQARHATVNLPQTAVVSLVLASGGTDVVVARGRTLASGPTKLSWTVPAIVSGRYSLEAVVTDGVDVVRTNAVRVRVKGLAAPSPTSSPSPSPPPPSPSSISPTPARHGTDVGLFILLGSVVLALGIAAVSILFLYRRMGGGPPKPTPFEPHEGPPGDGRP